MNEFQMVATNSIRASEDGNEPRSDGILWDLAGNDEKSGKSKSVGLKYTRHTAVISITIASVIIQCLAMAIEQSALLYFVGILALLLATVVGVRQVSYGSKRYYAFHGPFLSPKILISNTMPFIIHITQVTMAKMDTLCDLQNKLREEINELTGENNELHNNVNDLETEVDKVQDLERKLNDIALVDGSNVSHLVELVKENSIIIAKQSVSILTFIYPNPYDPFPPPN